MTTLLSAEEARDESQKVKIRLKLEAEEILNAKTQEGEEWVNIQIPFHIHAITRLINKEIQNPTQNNNVIFYTIRREEDKEGVLSNLLCERLEEKGYIAEYKLFPNFEHCYVLEISWR